MHANIAEWCIDNRVLFHPLNTRLDNPEETTIDKDVLKHLRNTILRPTEVSTNIFSSAISKTCRGLKELNNNRGRLKHCHPGAFEAGLEGKRKVPPYAPAQSDEDTAVGPVETAFGRDALANLVNTPVLGPNLASMREAYLSQGTPLHPTGQPKIDELTSMTRDGINLRWMLKQEQEMLYPEITSYELAKKGTPMRDIYNDFLRGTDAHLINMAKKLPKKPSDQERKAQRIAKSICQHMEAALGFQIKPIPEDEKNIPANSSPAAKAKAKQAWDASKLAWAQARVVQYPLRGIIDSTFAWRVTFPWSNLVGADPELKRRYAMMDVFECFPTQATKKLKDKHINEMRPFYIPVLVVENKTQPRAESNDLQAMKNQARNQRLFYCVSALRMLSGIQISNFSVIGLATVGQYGTLCAGWWSKDYIPGGSYNIALGDDIDEFTYDLTKGEDILQLMVVIFRLRELGYAVIDLVKDRSLPWIAASKESETLSPWSLASQVEHLGLATKEKGKAK
ncbi:hypothetical protein LXA43DRAFT_1064334 [Ganoderma leucocontextum]|nr:hypothetical protein LXA43DRAFT_1064334 [Ganoderma leucocontextum]